MTRGELDLRAWPLPEPLDDGRLPAYTSIGAYPLRYLTRDGLDLCAACASVPDEETSDPAIAADAHLEGPPLTCEDCGAQIESAYGDPDADETEVPA